MTQAITYNSLVAIANQTFPGFGISEISTGCECFDDENEVVTMSMYELPTEVREWIKTQVAEIGISEKVLCIVSSCESEVTCSDVAKITDMASGTNSILQSLAKNGLINERIERNGTRRYSAVKNAGIKMTSYKGVEYNEAEIQAMREWVKDCSWGEEYEDGEIDTLPAIAILRGINKNYEGGLSAFILANTEMFGFEII